jgi:2-alkyl-3-oxoalkanoate reductase
MEDVMRVFIAGATGTLGRPTVKLLKAHGHEVIGLTRSPARAKALVALGARAVIGDALDRVTMIRLVRDARPDQLLHLLTALPRAGALRKHDLDATNELRIHGTANLVHGAISAGVRRIVAESFVGIYGGAASESKTSEDVVIPPAGSGILAEAGVAMRSLEDQMRDARASGRIDTVALRIGFLYGSDVPSTQDMVKQARARRLFVPRDFGAVGSFVHADDAAAAIVAAVEQEHPSPLYNVVDDEPIALTAFLDKLTAVVAARPPRHVPAWILKFAAPVMAEFGRGSIRLANDRIKRELGWTPRYPTVDQGLVELAQHEATAA